MNCDQNVFESETMCISKNWTHFKGLQKNITPTSTDVQARYIPPKCSIAGNSAQTDYSIEETVEWLKNCQVLDLTYEKLQSYLKVGDPGCIQLNSYDFCDKQIYDSIKQAKDVFDEFGQEEVAKSRGRANLFERIKSLFFMNRAALKLANIDAVTNFMFTNIDKSDHHCDSKGPFYFADVCAGPGGFTEYILWRKSWLFKGFGFTLKDDHDFQLYNSFCASPSSFQTLYGATGDGNICYPDNIADFKTKVLFQTGQKGVHFMTSDGGFSVKGNETMQEVLSKNIYLCQCLVALEIVRPHGHFVTKMFDVFTRFSVGLIYLMYKCFKKVTILKPNASRPANGERYLICCDLQKNEDVENIRNYLSFVSKKLWEMKHEDKNVVLELVPLKRIKSDSTFYDYILNSNNKIGKRQIAALKKLKFFCKNPGLKENRQLDCRKKSLEYWHLPDRLRQDFDSDNKQRITWLEDFLDKTDWLKVPPLLIENKISLQNIYDYMEDWSFCALYSTHDKNKCNIYGGLGSKTCRWQDKGWVKVKNLKLSPGTVLYGEIVKETMKIEGMDEYDDRYRQCLHIIDAMYLGDQCLTDLTFSERRDLIGIYAESLNQEFEEKRIRIRKKPIHPLNSLSLSSIIHKDCNEIGYQHILPTIGFQSRREFHRTNSIMFLKNRRSSEDVPQQLMFALRTQLFLDEKGVPLFDDLVRKLK
ncbi:cap-specific mRNA (nucleoside-2'-O-)-methyltransferase 1 isoform X2 [Harmonia axyridis]|uniref:cap-specific mRNA (nucleoside-2'-O-)-methyltransferase 1 isoform X2 n=1 Tax=Harmonia axyridis TaxID=115357 RepID=UPI001E2773F7|nr:cap-specific mRNA (nucleoside-2'-O-)-methyltransferase 1 isoform X2 [Harmonia axyridis]